MSYLTLSDEYINNLFKCTRFGESIDNHVSEKRKLIKKTLQNLVDGYWTGHTAFHIVLNGGFILDGKKGKPKKLTALGNAFLNDL